MKDLEGLRGRDRELVEAAVEHFAHTGYGDLKTLKGPERHMRLRAGDWRIRFVYEHLDAIRILHIRNRREAYR